MPRTYGALGPQGSNEDLLIPRPDLAPPVVFLRGGPGSTRKERESYEEAQARRRQMAREGAMFREALRQQMRMARDADRARDFELAHRAMSAPLERQAMLAALRQDDLQREEAEAQRRHEMALAALRAAAPGDAAGPPGGQGGAAGVPPAGITPELAELLSRVNPEALVALAFASLSGTGDWRLDRALGNLGRIATAGAERSARGAEAAEQEERLKEPDLAWPLEDYLRTHGKRLRKIAVGGEFEDEDPRVSRATFGRMLGYMSPAGEGPLPESLRPYQRAVLERIVADRLPTNPWWNPFGWFMDRQDRARAHLRALIAEYYRRQSEAAHAHSG